MAILDTIKKAKAKVIDVTSDILSAPARAKAANQMKKADADVQDIKFVREAKGVQDGGDYRDPLFRARANVSNLKTTYEQDYAKKMSKKPNRF